MLVFNPAHAVTFFLPEHAKHISEAVVVVGNEMTGTETVPCDISALDTLFPWTSHFTIEGAREWRSSARAPKDFYTLLRGVLPKPACRIVDVIELQAQTRKMESQIESLEEFIDMLRTDGKHCECDVEENKLVTLQCRYEARMLALSEALSDARARRGSAALAEI